MKKINSLVLLAFLACGLQAQDVQASKAEAAPIVKAKAETQEAKQKPYYQGEVVAVEQAGGYTYLEIKEHSNKTFWAAVSRTEAKIGDFVRFKKELVTENFKSKALNKTFKELMFASDLQYRVSKEPVKK